MTEYIYYVTQAARVFDERHLAAAYKALWDRKHSPRKCEIRAIERDGSRHNLLKPIIKDIPQSIRKP